MDMPTVNGRGPDSLKYLREGRDASATRPEEGAVHWINANNWTGSSPALNVGHSCTRVTRWGTRTMRWTPCRTR